MRRRPIAEINVVPYIDVMLVLLVIFMLTTPFLNQGVEVDLPKAQARVIHSAEQVPLIISVNTQGDYFLNIADKPQQAIAPGALVTRIAAELQIAKELHQTRPVFIRADQQVNYGKIMQAMVMLQQAGADKMGLMTDSTNQPDRKLTRYLQPGKV